MIEKLKINVLAKNNNNNKERNCTIIFYQEKKKLETLSYQEFYYSPQEIAQSTEIMLDEAVVSSSFKLLCGHVKS